jgi:hypothetical protein
MKVKPNENYHLLGTSIKLDKNLVYDAEPATNQPQWEERGLIFVNEILLEKGEYEIVG